MLSPKKFFLYERGGSLRCVSTLVHLEPEPGEGSNRHRKYTGTVTDPRDAVVPGAEVTARNVHTGVETRATTNGSGVYILRFLPIGQYELTVTASGFSSQTIVFSLRHLPTLIEDRLSWTVNRNHGVQPLSAGV